MGKVLLGASCLIMAMLGAVHAQDSVSDLTVTLPTGKVVHFQTPEQKEKFEAARAAQIARTQQEQAKPQPTAAPTAMPSSLGHTALDDQPAASGKVNPTAPTFTADYYMAAPDTWVGKQITLSVAYLHIYTRKEREDGLKEVMAFTYNNSQGGANNQLSGGNIAILAKPDVMFRLMQLCGTHWQYNGALLKTTLIRGEIRKADKLTPIYSSGFNGYSSSDTSGYCFYVEK